MTDFKKFRYPLVIKEHHLDTFGHVNNAVYLALLEEARWEIVSAGGFDLKTIHELQIGPIILGCEIKFLKELRLREEVVIASQMLSYKKKIGRMHQTILNTKDEVCTDAILTFGLFDMKARKLLSPSDEWLQAVGAMIT